MTMKTIKLCGVLLISVLPISSIAQTSLLQDKSGETSIILNDKNAVFLNAGDGSISANISFNKPNWFIGSDVKFKSTEGVSKLLDGYDFKPEIDFALFGGNYLNSEKSTIHYVYYGLEFNATNYSLLNQDSTNTFQDKSFYGGAIQFGYNRIGVIKESSYLFGLSLDYRLTNNLEDLTPVETYSTFSLDSSNTRTLMLTDNKSGFSGNYSSFEAMNLNMDAYIYPHIIGGQIGFGGYLRSQFSGMDPRTNAGIGFVIGQKGAPSNVVFGVLYQFNDLFNQLNSENNFLKRGGLNIIAGYSF